MVGIKILHYKKVKKLSKGEMFQIHPQVQQDDWIVIFRIPMQRSEIRSHADDR